MRSLRQALVDYLAVRRALGYELVRAEKLLEQFLTYLEDLGEERLTSKTAIAWATLPQGADRSWWSHRLSVVRGFAAHLHAVDPAHEIPATDVLPWKRCRATPYLYSDEDIVALLVAAGTLRTPHRVATHRTLIGLLVVTGMRVGEAIGLDRGDFDSIKGVVVVRKGKFGKSRELPLHPSTVRALQVYLQRGDRPRSGTNTPAFFVSCAGTRLLYCNVQLTFRQLTHRGGLERRSATCRPRLHDLRHSFAVRTIVDGYRDEGDTEARLALLATYLGHVDPGKTYWYLSAAPELLHLAGSRLDHYLGGDS